MTSFIERLVLDGESAAEELFDNHTDVFWVDWKEPDDILATYCEGCIKSGKLTSDLDDTGLYLNYGDKRLKVPLTYSGADRHITLLALNELMTDDYEIRLVWMSDGGDTLAFAPLSVKVWTSLEEKYGNQAIEKAFMKLSYFPNVFTDPLRDHKPRISKKPWWKFWTR